MYKNAHNITTNYIINHLFKERAYYFDIKIFSYLFGISPIKASQWFKNLEKKGFIKEVEKGKYILLGFQPERVLSEPFFIGTKIIIPSYVSYWSALNFYGFTEQIPKTVFVASTKRKKSIVFEGVHFRFVKISPRKFFGYKEERSGELSYLIAEPEKALIDSLSQPRYAGGMEEVLKCLYNAKDEIQVDKLIEYAMIFGNMALNSRLGYALSRFGINADRLEPFKSKSFVKLDPQRENTKMWDKKWHINLNMPLEKILGFREVY